MKGKINKYYELEIFRNGKFEKTLCPFMKDQSGKYRRCGSHCALFGEPYKNEQGYMSLSLCHKTIVFNEGFFDERE